MGARIRTNEEGRRDCNRPALADLTRRIDVAHATRTTDPEALLVGLDDHLRRCLVAEERLAALVRQHEDTGRIGELALLVADLRTEVDHLRREASTGARVR